MTSKPKIAFFFFLIMSAIIMNSCNKDKNDVVPDVYIDFYVSLDDIEFFNLTAPGGVDTVNKFTNNLGYRAAGYDENGIILYRGNWDEFYAYDRTCPHDFVTNNKSIKVEIDGLYAVCPECGTKYALPANGTPASGIGRYPLKNYRTSFNGIVVHVWNNY